jgi:pyruvate dehydrogenase E2 component (dihydrolipoamide acetyltransferase)
MPKFEMSQETATVVEWLKQEGEEVKKGEPLLTVETDKVTMDIESPATGILAGVLVAPQQAVPVTEVIAYILAPGERLDESASRRVDSAQLASRRPRAAGAPIPDAPLSPHRPASLRATPVARRIAREYGVNLATVTGSGPRGRIQAADVRAVASVPSTLLVAGHDPSASARRDEAKVVPLVGVRRTIAERMTASYQTTPHIALTVRVDMGALEDLRARLNAKAQAAGRPHASVTALLAKTVAWALKRHPWLNSTLQDDDIHLLSEINVGVAVALAEGLIVPVVRDADRKGVAEIAAEVNDLAMRAREGRLAPADVAEGTFTISNLGPFGIEQFSAIINPPQAGILAVGSTRLEAVVDAQGQIIARPIMRMTLSVDHRIVDGAAAAHFLSDLREALEAPALLSLSPGAH